jgi:hypothetical protein
MSFLNDIRIVFNGRFQADVSTVNNDVRHFDNSTFEASFQEFQSKSGAWNGWWNPPGSGAFRLLDCRVVAAHYRDGTSAARDPVLGLSIPDRKTKLVENWWTLIHSGSSPRRLGGSLSASPMVRRRTFSPAATPLMRSGICGSVACWRQTASPAAGTVSPRQSFSQYLLRCSGRAICVTVMRLPN